MCKKKRMPSNNEREKLREEYYREGLEKWIKSEQKRLNQIFADLGEINDFHIYLDDYDSRTLSKLRDGVESGDKQAMMALLVVTADALDVFEVLPEDVRKALADSLQKMRISLEDDSKFFPRGSGNPSKNEKQKQSNKKYWTALKVEFLRAHKKISLEEAIAEVSEETGLTDSLVQKRWKHQHKNAKFTVLMMNSLKRNKQVAKSEKKK